MKIGEPLDDATQMGAIVNETQYKKVVSYIAEGLNLPGAKTVCGGLPPQTGPLSEGYFVEPTVFVGVRNDWRIVREEVFGPVLVAIPWKEEAEAIRMANDSHYGLAAFIYTHDLSKALRTAHEIESGFVQVNQGGGILPGQSYGGFKQSGLGPRMVSGRHAGKFYPAQDRHRQPELLRPQQKEVYLCRKHYPKGIRGFSRRSI